MRRWRGLIGPLLACLALVLVARRLEAVEVRGASMAPALQPGDRLLAWRTSRPARVGEVVLVADPRARHRELVKRVVATGPSGVRLAGDNSTASTDSRAFGVIPHHRVRWRVIARYWPLAAAGTMPPRSPAP